jgi:hypothetical protein
VRQGLAEGVVRTPSAGQTGPRGGRGRRHRLHRRGPQALPREGQALPGRLRPHAGRGAVRRRPPLDRARDRAQHHRGDRRPGDGERARHRADRRPGLPDRARAVQRRDQHPAADARRRHVRRARAHRARRPQPGRGAGARGARPAGDDRHPADAERAPARRERAERQPALRAAQRADLRRPRRGPAPGDRRRRAPVDVRRHDRARGGVHERAAAPAGRPVDLRPALERVPVHRRDPARGGRELAVLLRP